MHATLPSPPTTPEENQQVIRYHQLRQRYLDLSAGFWADSQRMDDTAMAGAPIAVVAGVGVGVIAFAWAVATYAQATNLREQTALADKELDARVEASREGRTLPPSTLPAPQDDGGLGWGWLVGGGLATAALLALPSFLRRS